ncbi:MAG TPA: DUF3857 domain-containing protein [Gemmatimonadales bacterium]|nr:DUF3857 domain-containing protein [Gemmatimonadales bacterium]
MRSQAPIFIRALLAGMSAFAVQAGAIAQQPPQRSPALADYAGQPLVFERIREVLRFDDDGRGVLTVAVRVRVQTEAGLQALGQLALPYSAANERLDVDTVRVRKAGGGVVLAPASAVQDVTTPIAREAPVYSDLRAKVVTVPGLRPGDTLEYHLTWTVHTPLAPGQFWWVRTFSRAAIVLNQTLTLGVPRARALHVKTRGLAPPNTSEAGERRTYEWHFTNLQVDTTGERHSRPGRLASEPYAVEISSFPTWEDVGRWYAGLERERETVTPELRAKAESLVAGRKTLRDSVAALYDYVTNQFRYVSLSFGLGRYQPHAAAEVLSNQYGDCKDKHTLLAALLRAIGVQSAPVLISSERELDPEMPSPLQFDHLITYVRARADTLWLDATPAGAPFGFLWSALRGKGALLMPLDGAPSLVRTPATTPVAPFQHVVVQGALDDLGKLSATVRYTLRGDAEVAMRELFRQIPSERLPSFVQTFAQQEGLNGTASSPSVANPQATTMPFELSLHLEGSALSWKDHRAEYAIPLPKLDLPAVEQDTGSVRDTTPLDLAEESADLQLELPPAITASLPVPVTLTRDYATYHSTYELVGRSLIAHRSLAWRHQDLPPERAPDLRAFVRGVRADEDQEAELTRAGDAPIPATANVAELHQAGYDALRAGDARTAVRLFRQVVQIEPRHQFAWNNLGRAYLQLGLLDSAVACFKQQIAINPYDQYSYNSLGRALWRRRDYEGAVTAFKKQIEVTPLDGDAHSNLGRLYVALHRDSDAVSELEKAVSINPRNAFLHVDLGKAYLTTHRSDLATAEFDRAVELAPIPPVQNNIAYALAELGTNLDRAERYVRAAIEATATPLRDATIDSLGIRQAGAVSSLGAYWDTLGWIYFRRGDLVRAERYVHAAWLLAQHGEIGDHLAQIYERLGRKQEAIHAYALALNGTSPPLETRGRLVALAGGASAADQLVEGARSELVTLRTVRLGTRLHEDVSSEVRVLLGPGPKVEDVRFVGGSAAVRGLGEVIRQTTFPVEFPDSTAIKLPRKALLTCSAATGACAVVLIEPERSLTVSAQVTP